MTLIEKAAAAKQKFIGFAEFVPLGKLVQRKYLVHKDAVVHMNLIARYSYIGLESTYHWYRKG